MFLVSIISGCACSMRHYSPAWRCAEVQSAGMLWWHRFQASWQRASCPWRLPWQLLTWMEIQSLGAESQ